MARAISSFPVPVSPSSNTVESLDATVSTSSKNLFQSRTVTNDLIEIHRATNLFFQIQLLLGQLVFEFGSFAEGESVLFPARVTGHSFTFIDRPRPLQLAPGSHRHKSPARLSYALPLPVWEIDYALNGCCTHRGLPFLKSAGDCAVNLIQQQRRKGDELSKNGGLRDLFGVYGEALSDTKKKE